ncbi:MAG: hypothetical protein ACLQJF_00665 [Candidatus Sulfotelmatobacter sp.]
MATTDREGLSAKFGHWTALYAAYLFLAGWAYLRHYFGVFGVDTGWLDLGLNDTIAQGFSVLFGRGWPLSLVYFLIFLLSLVLEVFCVNRSRKVDVGVACGLVLFFPVTFWVAGCAGISRANRDRGDKTSLPTITFAAGPCGYLGKVVYVKGEALYIYNLAYLEAPAKSIVCPFDLNDLSSKVPQLWLMRSGDLKDVRAVHYEKEAKPWLCCADER